MGAGGEGLHGGRPAVSTILRLALRLLEREERLRPDAGWHPSAEELTAYHDGRLSARRAARVCRHLGVCFDCPDRLLALGDFLKPLPEEDSPETAASWQELRRRLFPAPPSLQGNCGFA